MRLSSWHIAAFGFLLQFAVFGIAGIALIGGSLIALIPLPFLFFSRTRKIGAIIALVVGIPDMLFAMTRVASIFITIAGLFEIWKQRKR